MSLQQDLKQETVDQLHLREAIMMRPEQSVRDAVLAMRKAELGCVIIVDDRKKPVGIFTEAMLRIAINQNPKCIDDSLADHVATVFPWVATDDPIETVMDAMEVKNHRFVVVLDDTGKIVGLTGQKGLMEYIAEHFSEEVMVQRIGSEAYPAKREGA